MNPPITSRTLLFERLRDGSLMPLDWNLVNTTLGAMIEPRTLIRATGATRNEDIYDSAYTDWLILDGQAMSALGLGGMHRCPARKR